jgi:hypothetical protein
MTQRIVTVTPAGRKVYLEILAAYLLQNRKHIQEHRFWVNTTNEEDIAYLEALAREHPDFFKLVRREYYDADRPNHSIWQYFQDCTDDDTIYIRLDDDICYIAPDAIPSLAAFRVAHREPFLVYGNIVNNAICSYYQQERGLLPLSWGKVEHECMGPVGWGSKVFAQRLHVLFLKDIRRGNTARWKFPPKTLDDYRRFSINVICWFGHDMKQVRELSVPDLSVQPLAFPPDGHSINNEEVMLSEYLPFSFGRANMICGDALFGHFAYYPQRAYLEQMTTLLEEYRELIDPQFARSQRLRRPVQRIVKPLSAVRSPRAWKFLRRVTHERLTG